MGKKEDWEELEKWNQRKEEENKEQYGIDLSNISNEHKKIKKFSRALNFTGKIFMGGGIIILIRGLFLLLVIVSIILSNQKNSFSIDVKKDIETSHFCKVKLISKDVVKSYGLNNENGIYYFEVIKCPEIKFTAIKNGGINKYDYVGHLQKYLFDNWDNPEKEKFKTEEYTSTNGLLNYRNYIETSSFEEVMQSTECIIQFMQYAEHWNAENKVIKNPFQHKNTLFIAPLGGTFIRFKGYDILPYSESCMTEDAIRENSKRQYFEILDLIENKM